MIETVFFDALRAAIGPTAAAYALLAIGLNLHFGFTGLLNFGQVGFMLVGGYGLAIPVAVYGRPLWVGFLTGITASVVLALLLGAPTLRLRADYLAITTIASAEILRFLSRNSSSEDVTGGVYGLRQFAGDFYAVSPFGTRQYLGRLAFSGNRMWAMSVGWGLAILLSIAIHRLMRSPWGRVLRSIREDEDAARSLGKNVFLLKMQSLILGGVVGGLGGMVFVLSLQTIQPDMFLSQVTFFAFTMVILGGTATAAGPIVGTILFWFLITGLQSGVRTVVEAGLIPGVAAGQAVGAITLIVVGLMLMVLMIFRPQGLLGDREELRLDVR
jgi:branched-chain amino acid transport system permease protein